MIIPEKKKAVGIIMAKYKPDGTYADGGEVKNEEQIMPDMAPFHAHAQSIMSAIHNKSPGEFVTAMRNFLDAHELHEDEPESNKEEPSDYEPHK